MGICEDTLFWNIIIGSESILAMITILIQIIIFIQWINRTYLHWNITNKFYTEREPTKDEIQLSKQSSDFNPSSDEAKSSDVTTTSTSTANKSISINIKKRRRVASAPIKLDNKSKLIVTLSILFSLVYVSIFGTYGFFMNCFFPDFVSQDMLDKSSYIFILILLSRGLLYIFYLRRLYITFNKSAYNLSDKQYMILYIWLILTTIIVNVYFITLDILSKEYNLIGDLLLTSRWLLAGIFDIFWALLLVIMFVKRLKAVINEVNKVDSNAQKPSIIRFNKTVTKLTILTTVASISTIITLLLSFIPGQSFVFLIFIDVTINSVCLIFTFAVYDNEYKRYCYLCRKCCSTNIKS